MTRSYLFHLPVEGFPFSHLVKHKARFERVRAVNISPPGEMLVLRGRRKKSY